jgi:hypothetical protein
VAAFLLIAALTRLGLIAATGADALPARYWPEALLLGIWFDLATLAWLLAPLLVFRALLPNALLLGRGYAWFRLAAFSGLLFLLLFAAAAEWTFWEEFSSRFDCIAVDDPVYTHEVIGNIVESYPLGWIVAALAGVAGGVTWTARRSLLRRHAQPRGWRSRLAYLSLAPLLPGAAYRFADVDQMADSTRGGCSPASTHRHPHRARPGGLVPGHPADPGPGHRAAPGQRPPGHPGRDPAPAGLRVAVPLWRPGLLRQHERLLRRQRLARLRPHRLSQGLHRVREHLGRRRRIPV